MRKFGAALRMLREERGETLARCAERGGVSRSYLSRLEHPPEGISEEFIPLVAKAYGASVADIQWLLERTKKEE